MLQHHLDIRDFGAREDGPVAENTAAFTRAMEAARDAGGGTVLVPAGVWQTGTFRIYSHTCLFLSAGARLKASSDISDFPVLDLASIENHQTSSLIWAADAEHIHIEGPGEIDFNDAPFIQWDRIKTDPTFPDELVEQLDARQRSEATVVAADRYSRAIFFDRCDNVRVRDVTLVRSPTWTLVMRECTRVRISSIVIDDHLQVPNADGIHLCGCREVVISNCLISCADDCIAITGISTFETVSEDILISGCILRSRSACIRIGHLASKVRRVTLSNLMMRESHRGIGLFAGPGGWVEDISVTDVQFDTRIYAGHWWGNGEPVVISAAESPDARISGVQFTGLRGRAENGVVACGTGENISAIEFTDFSLEVVYGANRPLLGRYIDLQPAGCRRAPDPTKYIPWLYLDEVRDIRIRHARISRSRNSPVPFSIKPATGRVSGLVRTDVIETPG